MCHLSTEWLPVPGNVFSVVSHRAPKGCTSEQNEPGTELPAPRSAGSSSVCMKVSVSQSCTHEPSLHEFGVHCFCVSIVLEIWVRNYLQMCVGLGAPGCLTDEKGEISQAGPHRPTNQIELKTSSQPKRQTVEETALQEVGSGREKTTGLEPKSVR